MPQVLRDGRFIRSVRKSRRVDRDITVVTLDGGFYFIRHLFLYEERCSFISFTVCPRISRNTKYEPWPATLSTPLRIPIFHDICIYTHAIDLKKLALPRKSDESNTKFGFRADRTPISSSCSWWAHRIRLGITKEYRMFYRKEQCCNSLSRRRPRAS